MRARVAVAFVLFAACAEGQRSSVASPFAVSLPTPGRGPGEPPSWEVPVVARTGERNRCIDRALANRKLPEIREPAEVSDDPFTTRKRTDRYDDVMRTRPDIAIECSHAPGEAQW